MSEQSGEQLEEEPQSERGPEGSRDTGSEQPSGGPVDRPEGSSDKESDTSIAPEGAERTEGPDLQSGGN